MNQTKQDQGSLHHAPHATRATGEAGSMPDMQKSHDDRNIAIDKVGVKDIRYPIVVMDKSKEQQQTVARINMYVDLPHQSHEHHAE
jgi:GTP cyclohydrolase I